LSGTTATNWFTALSFSVGFLSSQQKQVPPIPTNPTHPKAIQKPQETQKPAISKRNKDITKLAEEGKSICGS
jgi:hypothetical protein